QLQNGADVLALAGAAELDRLPDSETRARTAIKHLLTNSTLFGSGASRTIALGASLAPAGLDRDGAALHPAKLAQRLHKGGDPCALACRSAAAQETVAQQSHALGGEIASQVRQAGNPPGRASDATRPLGSPGVPSVGRHGQCRLFRRCDGAST